jgi:SnoaL-like polyketide cyclase
MHRRKDATQKGVSSMSTEENKAIVRKVFEEVLNKGNVATVDQLFAPNCVVHLDYPLNVPVPSEYQQSIEEIKHFVSQFRTTFHDLCYTVELQIAEGIW